MQQQPTNNRSYGNSEISLLEIWQILEKRKWLILSAVILSGLVGSIYAHLKPQVFETSVTLRIGQVQTGTAAVAPLPLESPQDVLARLSANDNGAITALIPKGANNLVTITSVASDAEKAAGTLQAAVKRVMTAHAKIFNTSIQPASSRISQIDVQLEAIKQQLAIYDELAKRLRDREPAQAAIMIMQRSALTHSLLQLESERWQLALMLATPQTSQSELLGVIAIPAHPSNPKKLLIAAFAAMLGLMGGVALTFLAEFRSKAKAIGDVD
ncbi:Wzz/FepE/Etk N-terminal domain-containing protein [Herbaspirillum seropedicae]|uniref:Wzz/FepE/Etk N-terminal domain-containing protein n=1 Tax=Herbaspirillum seropedicae TaxID=964 RepID=UPI003D9672FA